MRRALRGRFLRRGGSALGTALALACLGPAGCGPSDPVAAVRAQLAAGDFQGSLEPLRELIAERPEDAELHYLYGRALASTGQPSLAEWPLRKAMEDPKWRVAAGLHLAAGALQTRNYPSAIEVTTRLLEADPENLHALLIRANAYARSNLHREEALADVERIFELDPENVEAMEPRILALLGLERVEEAGQALEELGRRIEATQVGPGLSGRHCATTAIFAEESGELELARARWAECVARFPGHPNVVANAIEFHDARDEPDRSLAILRRALEAEPSSQEYRVVLAQRLRLAGEPAEAEAVLRAATSSPDPHLAAAAWTDLAAHYADVGQKAAEADAVRHAVELAQGLGGAHPALLLIYADALLRAGQLDRALAVADEMTVVPHRELVRARVAQERGRPAEAIGHFEEALRLWPDNAFARYYAALAWEALGNFDRAVDEYRYAIRISPGATDSRARVARLLAAEGRPAEALALLQVKRGREPLDPEGELLALRLAARVGDAAALRASRRRLERGSPDRLGRAVASLAEGVRERSGPAAALQAVRAAEGVDLRDPRDADALRALVRLSHQAGGSEPEGARADLRGALAAHPDAAVLHEIEGLDLELRGSPGEEVRAAYARALELDPGNGRALAALGRLALAREPEQALALFDRAAEADPRDAEARRGAARALVASGRSGEAEQRLEALLREHPYDEEAATTLVELQLLRGIATDRTLELAERAVRFGGGARALDLLSRVHQGRNDPGRAAEAAARARALRGEQAPGGAGDPGGEKRGKETS
jgi:tetratricopeptide (TPR) repeat protein